jgi:hypothetical protein
VIAVSCFIFPFEGLLLSFVLDVRDDVIFTTSHREPTTFRFFSFFF